MTVKTLAEAVARFGTATKAKLDNPAAVGQPEDQLRKPIEDLVFDIAPLLGLAAHDVDPFIGESAQKHLQTRPDFAVTRKKALIGFIELKAPGKSCDPRTFKDGHDKTQWDKLKALPNLIYSDGNGFSLWQDGKLARLVQLSGDVRTAGAKLVAPDELLALFTDFFQWDPIAPTDPGQLADVSARLCRLLRDEVEEQLKENAKGLTALKQDWRKLLFPHASDAEFADGYAQAVTFGLLMAKARGLALSDGLDAVAKKLRKTNSLIGSALRLLTDEAEEAETLTTSLRTLTRVLDGVEWSKITKDDPEAWLYFYEKFLTAYDRDLRRKTGSYYTPPEVVTEMVRLVDEVLRSPARFALPSGLASTAVTVADPAVGTGTFLLGILRKIAEIARDDGGPGNVPGVIEAALARLIGFEIQFGPFAVAQLRLLAEIYDLTNPDEEAASDGAGDATSIPLRLYITDTLADPDEEVSDALSLVMPIAESRREANRVKRSEPITVVIGNPPYKNQASGMGGWIENGRDGLNAPLSTWTPPGGWGVGEHAKHLKNLYVYFWRWATWKVFGAPEPSAPETPWSAGQGVICFITVAGFLNGQGFQKMRADLRRDAGDIWVIDCTPEGHQPPVASRIFQDVQQPVCIVMASRSAANDPEVPARVRYRALPAVARTTKFAALAGIGLEDDGWTDAADGWRASFLPERAASWRGHPALSDLFAYDGSGVMPGRTWVIAPDAKTLEDRWNKLINEPDPARKAMLFHPHLRNEEPGDKHVDKKVEGGLGTLPHRTLSVAKDKEPVLPPIRYGFRSFDRQWIIPDSRLINQPNPKLWAANSNSQIELTAPSNHPPRSGPALTFTALLPDMDHYNGRGGRAFPLWADAAATQTNLRPTLLAELSAQLGGAVSGESLFAYIAAVAAHPGYVATFAEHLIQPGLRIPLTADRKIFDDAIALGREVIWLHTFGDRFAEGRAPGPPRITTGGPTIPIDGRIPTKAGEAPETIEYDPMLNRLRVGKGHIDNVPVAVWEYEVSGKRVLSQWFSYRGKDRTRPIIGDRRPPSPLGDIQPDGWLDEYTQELLNVVHVLGRLVALEPAQAAILKRIVDGPTLDAEVLRMAGALPEEAED